MSIDLCYFCIIQSKVFSGEDFSRTWCDILVRSKIMQLVHWFLFQRIMNGHHERRRVSGLQTSRPTATEAAWKSNTMHDIHHMRPSTSRSFLVSANTALPTHSRHSTSPFPLLLIHSLHVSRIRHSALNPPFTGMAAFITMAVYNL